MDQGIQELLLGPDSMRYLRLLRDLSFGGSPSHAEKELVDELVALEVCERAGRSVRLSAFGVKCADAAREYIFWIERNRRLHREGDHKTVELEHFREQDVLEIGPGWGCNLFRIQPVARRAVGLEIEPVYIELSRVFAQIEGVDPPELHQGRCEAMPFSDASFDRLLLFSALQYMDVRQAFREINRVMRPGALVLTTLAPLDRYLRKLPRQISLSRPKTVLTQGAVLANTLWYQGFGRRLRPNQQGNATARPIYPTTSYLIDCARRQGLQFRPDLSYDSGADVGLVLERSA